MRPILINLAENVIASQEVKVIPLYKKPIVWLSSAAAAIVILVVVNYSAPRRKHRCASRIKRYSN